MTFYLLPSLIPDLILMLCYVYTAFGIRKGMQKMQKAFEIYPYCAMALNYLANHFFFTGQHFLVEQLTETALAVTNHGPTKSHSYYNLARSYHSKVWYLSNYYSSIIALNPTWSASYIFSIYMSLVIVTSVSNAITIYNSITIHCYFYIKLYHYV